MSDPPRILSVSELNGAARTLLEGHFGDVWVEGEVSKTTYAGSGHLYFSLADEGASIDAVMWRSSVSRAPFRLQAGMKVQARGELTVYPARGHYQIVVRTVRDAGIGDAMQALEQLKRKLQAEGLFAENRKRPLPRFPKRIGLITSATGAAVHDMVDTIKRRWPLAQMCLSPAIVQGESCTEDLVRALKRLLEEEPCDVIIIGRGGGAPEDLMGFNGEALLRAIAAAPTPIISAVGHEIDFTLCDLVADVRAKTPTEAGEFAVPDHREIRLQIGRWNGQLLAASRRRIDRYAMDIGQWEKRLGSFHPRQRLGQISARVDALCLRLHTSMRSESERRRAALDQLSGRLAALSPLAVLDRGYAMVLRGPDVISDVGQLNPGEEIHIRFARGEIDADVKEIHPDTTPQ